MCRTVMIILFVVCFMSDLVEAEVADRQFPAQQFVQISEVPPEALLSSAETIAISSTPNAAAAVAQRPQPPQAAQAASQAVAQAVAGKAAAQSAAPPAANSDKAAVAPKTVAIELVITPPQQQVAPSSASRASAALPQQSNSQQQTPTQAQSQIAASGDSIVPIGVIQAQAAVAESRPLSQPQASQTQGQAQQQTITVVTASFAPTKVQGQVQAQASGAEAKTQGQAQLAQPVQIAQPVELQAQPQTVILRTLPVEQAPAVQSQTVDANAKTQVQVQHAQGQPQSQTVVLSTKQIVQPQAVAANTAPQTQVQTAQAQAQSQTETSSAKQPLPSQIVAKEPVQQTQGQTSQDQPQSVTVVTSNSSPKLQIDPESAKQLTQQLAAQPNSQLVVTITNQVASSQTASPAVVSIPDSPSPAPAQVEPSASPPTQIVREEQAPTAPEPNADSAQSNLRAGAVLKKPQGIEIETTSDGWKTMFAAIIQSASFALFVKAACMVSNVIFQVSPLPQVQHWVSQSCTGEADAAPFVAIAFGGWQWCFYGVFAWLITQRSGFLILVHSNCLGALLGTYYGFAFKRNCKSQSALNGFWAYLRVAAGLAVIQFSAMLILPIAKALFLSGIIASLCSVASALSTLVTLPAVIKTGRSDSIPGAVVWAGLASAVIWFICGLMLGDPCILIPNGFAIVTGVICVALKVKYPSGDEIPSKDVSKLPPSMASRGEKAALNSLSSRVGQILGQSSERNSSSSGEAPTGNVESPPSGEANPEQLPVAESEGPAPPTELTPLLLANYGGTGGTC